MIADISNQYLQQLSRIFSAHNQLNQAMLSRDAVRIGQAQDHLKSVLDTEQVAFRKIQHQNQGPIPNMIKR